MQEIVTDSLFILSEKYFQVNFIKKKSFDGYLISTTPNVSAGVYYSQ